jgi:diketogulonate reductase-like aldo/keto reductase
VRYIGCSNFSGWHLMKSLAASDRRGWPRYLAHQAYYSLIGRDFEWELMPLGHDQGVGTLVWSPLGWGRLTGKIRRNQPPPAVSRLPKTAAFGPQVADDHLYKVVDALDEVAKETGRTVPQIALNWLTARPTISSVIIGARNEEQLRQNLGAVGWSLTAERAAARRRERAAAALSLLAPAPGGSRNPPPPSDLAASGLTGRMALFPAVHPAVHTGSVSVVLVFYLSAPASANRIGTLLALTLAGTLVSLC